MNRINTIPTMVKNVITILRPIEYPCVVIDPKKISAPAQIYEIARNSVMNSASARDKKFVQIVAGIPISGIGKIA